ncbi:MAG TPA: NADH-quinone oxidoreductase subunit A [Actinophytocola sp.]|uniref:NADH-quinone oxidoreductase subunit A n=1 Tax=Actinophytocola sp. TaxID=1872138 RepID=UPI002DBF7E98|nr:NADH-quinone oxidoreductase subunit A [Actinophytocola sp.]HEU5471869.1 NADH-quinone oxidoreductase subunit A [Actinophytocola sp.]
MSAPREVSPVDGYGGGYALVAVLLVVGVVIFVGAVGVNRVWRPDRSTARRVLSDECGVDLIGGGRAQSYVRYYVFTFFYLVFAVDAVFLFPWATVFGFGGGTLVAMFVVLGFLAVGILYAWRTGVLSWG